MSTMTRSKPSKPPVRVRRAPPIVGEARIVIRGVDWEIYDKLSDAVSEGQHVRMAYDGKDLEIMTTGNVHEHYKDFFGQFVSEVATELSIPRLPAGETTWKRPEIARGLEADQCYYFQPDKLAADAAALKRRSRNIDDYPNPDLAIEIDISPSQIDRPAIYAALRVAEVWRFDGKVLVIEQLRPDGSYVAIESSQYLPIQADEILRWIAVEDSVNRTAWERRLRDWIRAELLGRRAGPRKRPRRKK
jgi:Uma2 family endonuclease